MQPRTCFTLINTRSSGTGMQELMVVLIMTVITVGVVPTIHIRLRYSG